MLSWVFRPAPHIGPGVVVVEVMTPDGRWQSEVLERDDAIAWVAELATAIVEAS